VSSDRGERQELVVDVRLNERARRAGADLALVEGEHREALERLVLVVVVGGQDVGEEHVGALAAEFEGDGDQVLRGVLHDQTAGSGLTGERDLGDPRARREWLTRLGAEAVDDVDDTRRKQVADDGDQVQDRRGRLLGRLENDSVACSKCGSELPHGHEDREVPRNDLSDDAEGLVEVVGHRVLVDLRQRTLLRPNASGEVAEVVDGERNVRVEGLSDRLTVVPGFGERDGLQVLRDPVGDLVEDDGTLCCRGLAPGRSGGMGRIEGELDVLGRGAGDLAEVLTGDGSRVLEVLPLDGWYPLATDPVVVARLERHLCIGGTWAGIDGHLVTPSSFIN
jgi:hypothetical protein